MNIIWPNAIMNIRHLGVTALDCFSNMMASESERNVTGILFLIKINIQPLLAMVHYTLLHFVPCPFQMHI